jgi:hypothetical protein
LDETLFQSDFACNGDVRRIESQSEGTADVIKDPLYWEKWERETQLRRPADFRANLRLLEAMYEEARALGIMAQPPSLEGLESRLRLAKALNVPTTS